MSLKDSVKLKEYRHYYYVKNRDIASEKNKAYYDKNRSGLIERARLYIIRNKEKTDHYQSRYRSSPENVEKRRAYDKRYHRENRHKINVQVLNKKRENMQFKLQIMLRSRLCRALRGEYKSGSAVRDLGCTIDELKFYLEGQFKDGMTWNNWSMTGWHIDHKMPLSFFDLTDREQLKHAVHYTNLQPMWAMENIRKSNKIIV